MLSALAIAVVCVCWVGLLIELRKAHRLLDEYDELLRKSIANTNGWINMCQRWEKMARDSGAMLDKLLLFPSYPEEEEDDGSHPWT